MEDSIREATSYLPLLAVVLMYTGFALGYGQLSSCCKVIIITFYRKISLHPIGELLPTDMRSFGSGLLGILDNISLFVSVKMGPTIISSLGWGVPSCCTPASA